MKTYKFLKHIYKTFAITQTFSTCVINCLDHVTSSTTWPLETNLVYTNKISIQSDAKLHFSFSASLIFSSSSSITSRHQVTHHWIKPCPVPTIIYPPRRKRATNA